ncbi:hypothetical protein ACP4OV_002696 [Aristida adscensionis]
MRHGGRGGAAAPGRRARRGLPPALWRAVVDARGLLLPHVLPHAVRGIFVNCESHGLPFLFARASPEPPLIGRGGRRGCVQGYYRGPREAVIDHCNSLLLCGSAYRSSELVVVNPATRRWDRIVSPRMDRFPSRDYAMYLVFDPAVSPHYEVFLIPLVPEKPKAMDPRDIPSETFNVSGLFSSLDGTLCAEDTEDEEEEEVCTEESFGPPPSPSMEEGFFPPRRLPMWFRWKLGEPQDTYGSMEWPPSPCTLHVFSSRLMGHGTKQGQGARRRGLLSRKVTPWEQSWIHRIAMLGSNVGGTVYFGEEHCTLTAVVILLSLTIGKYHIIKTPVGSEEKDAKPYVGISAGVYFATSHGFHLRIWVLNESSSGQMEWTLKHDTSLKHSDLWAALRMSEHGQIVVSPWMLAYAKYVEDSEEHSWMLAYANGVEDSEEDSWMLAYANGVEDSEEYSWMLGYANSVEDIEEHPEWDSDDDDNGTLRYKDRDKKHHIPVFILTKRLSS